MKIAQIAPPWIAIPPKNYGGTENVLATLVEAQVAQGHDVTLLAPGDARTSARHIAFFPHSLIEEGVPWQAHLKAYYHLHQAFEYVQEHNFDIVHTHLSSTADMYMFPLMASLSTPHITTLHCNFPFDRLQDEWIGDADHYYLRWAASMPIVAISERSLAVEQSDLHFVGVVHHGLALHQFLPTVKQPENFFVWLGRLHSDKGAHRAIAAARKAGVPLVLAGTIHDQSYFQQEIQPLLDGEQIRYIGPVNMEQKIDLLSRARAMLNPIQWEEPFGMVMIEAMAVGCPVIAFAQGAAPELIIHEKTGFLIESVDEMVEAIARIDIIDRQTTRTHIAHNFSDCAMAEKYACIYRQVIAARQKNDLSPLAKSLPSGAANTL